MEEKDLRLRIESKGTATIMFPSIGYAGVQKTHLQLHESSLQYRAYLSRNK